VISYWRQTYLEIQRLLTKRHDFIRKLEQTEALRGVSASMFTEEYQSVYQRRRRVNRLAMQSTFALLLAFVPIVLVIGTVLRLTPGLEPIYHFIQPLAPTPTKIP